MAAVKAWTKQTGKPKVVGKFGMLKLCYDQATNPRLDAMKIFFKILVVILALFMEQWHWNLVANYFSGGVMA